MYVYRNTSIPACCSHADVLSNSMFINIICWPQTMKLKLIMVFRFMSFPVSICPIWRESLFWLYKICLEGGDEFGLGKWKSILLVFFLGMLAFLLSEKNRNDKIKVACVVKIKLIFYRLFYYNLIILIK